MSKTDDDAPELTNAQLAEAMVKAEIVEEDEDDTPEDRFPWAIDDEERCRSAIMEIMASADIDGKIMVWNMETVYQWVRQHVIPPETKKKNV